MDVSVIQCTYAECGEDIRKNRKGLFPKYCPECNELVIIPVETPKVDLLKCVTPGCGGERKKNKRGCFPKHCVECNEPLPSETSDSQSSGLVTSTSTPALKTDITPPPIREVQSVAAHMVDLEAGVKLVGGSTAGGEGVSGDGAGDDRGGDEGVGGGGIVVSDSGGGVDGAGGGKLSTVPAAGRGDSDGLQIPTAATQTQHVNTANPAASEIDTSQHGGGGDGTSAGSAPALPMTAEGDGSLYGNAEDVQSGSVAQTAPQKLSQTDPVDSGNNSDSEPGALSAKLMKEMELEEEMALPDRHADNPDIDAELPAGEVAGSSAHHSMTESFVMVSEDGFTSMDDETRTNPELSIPPLNSQKRNHDSHEDIESMEILRTKVKRPIDERGLTGLIGASPDADGNQLPHAFSGQQARHHDRGVMLRLDNRGRASGSLPARKSPPPHISPDSALSLSVLGFHVWANDTTEDPQDGVADAGTTANDQQTDQSTDGPNQLPGSTVPATPPGFVGGQSGNAGSDSHPDQDTSRQSTQPQAMYIKEPTSDMAELNRKESGSVQRSEIIKGPLRQPHDQQGPAHTFDSAGHEPKVQGRQTAVAGFGSLPPGFWPGSEPEGKPDVVSVFMELSGRLDQAKQAITSGYKTRLHMQRELARSEEQTILKAAAIARVSFDKYEEAKATGVSLPPFDNPEDGLGEFLRTCSGNINKLLVVCGLGEPERRHDVTDTITDNLNVASSSQNVRGTGQPGSQADHEGGRGTGSNGQVHQGTVVGQGPKPPAFGPGSEPEGTLQKSTGSGSRELRQDVRKSEVHIVSGGKDPLTSSGSGGDEYPTQQHGEPDFLHTYMELMRRLDEAKQAIANGDMKHMSKGDEQAILLAAEGISSRFKVYEEKKCQGDSYQSFVASENSMRHFLRQFSSEINRLLKICDLEQPDQQQHEQHKDLAHPTGSANATDPDKEVGVTESPGEPDDIANFTELMERLNEAEKGIRRGDCARLLGSEQQDIQKAAASAQHMYGMYLSNKAAGVPEHVVMDAKKKLNDFMMLYSRDLNIVLEHCGLKKPDQQHDPQKSQPDDIAMFIELLDRLNQAEQAIMRGEHRHSISDEQQQDLLRAAVNAQHNYAEYLAARAPGISPHVSVDTENKLKDFMKLYSKSLNISLEHCGLKPPDQPQSRQTDAPAYHTRSTDPNSQKDKNLKSSANETGPGMAGDPPDIVSVFTDLKGRLDQAKRVISMGGKTLLKKLTNGEQDYIAKAAADAQKRYANYEANKRMNSSSALTEAENGLRKCINTYSVTVNPLLIKCGVQELAILQVASSKHKDKSRTVTQPQKAIPHTGRKITFKVILASVITQTFEKAGRDPVVEIRCSIDNFQWPLVTLEKGADGIWTGLWPVTARQVILTYKYFIHDGENLTTDCFEWLGVTTYSRKVVDRHLDLCGLTEDTTVYDGVAVLKSDSWVPQKVKSFFSTQYLTKEQEQEIGVLAMLPNWTEEVQKGTPLKQLCVWINGVIKRQYDCFARFPTYYSHDHVLSKVTEARRSVDKIARDYILRSVEQHLLMMDTSFTMWPTIASLVGLLHIASAKSATWDDLLQRSPQLIITTMERVGTLPELLQPLADAESVITMLRVDDKFVKELGQSLGDVMEKLTASRDHFETWIRLIPLRHLLASSGSFQLNRGDNCDVDEWWGTRSISRQIRKLKDSYPAENAWINWLNWLSPYCTIDPVLPYTFLALLRDVQLVNVLHSTDERLQNLLPLDGVLACARYHVKSSYHGYYPKEIIAELKMFVGQRRASQQSSSCGRALPEVAKTGLDILGNLLEILLPRTTTSGRDVNDSVFSTVQMYLFVMEELLAADETVDITSIGVPLVYFSDRLISVFEKNPTYTTTFHTSTYGHSRVTSEEIRHWTALFTCVTEASKISEWWFSQCKKTFKQRLENVGRASPMAVVDLYCNHNFDVPAMDECVADAAFPRAENLLKQGNAGHLAGAAPEKIGKLVDQALTKAWDSADESPMSIVRNMIKWGNFLSVWNFYQQISERDRRYISNENELRLSRSASALESVLNDIVNGKITFADFTFLYGSRAKLLELCEVSKELYQKRAVIEQGFELREKERLHYVEFHRDVSDFWSYCDTAVQGKRVIESWLKRKLDDLVFCETFTSEPTTVICPHIPHEIREILNPFLRIKQRVVFLKSFIFEVGHIHQGSFADVAKSFVRAVDKYERTKAALADGTIDIAKLDELQRRYFARKAYAFLDELKFMVDEHVFKARKTQIKLCAHLDEYQNGARVMLDLKKLFGLTGNFTDMEKIVESGDKKLMLKDISNDLVASAESIKDITPQQISCLKAFTECTDMVEWARTEVPKKDISNFVDLASSTLGEDDLAATKTRYLLNALTGYTPLLYDFTPADTDYNSFIDLCKRVWEAMAQNPELEDNLRKSALELEWLKKVKTHFGNVEMKSMAQATSINGDGTYHIGNIQNHSKDFKSLDDVMLLKCKVEEKGKKVEKVYTYTDLKDLQSKLTLVAGEQQEKNKETIQRFDAMRDAVENLAQAYIEIRREGCIQFDDFLAVVHCNPKHRIGIEVRLQSINQVMAGLNSEKPNGALQHCQDLHQYLKNCITKWRQNLNEQRGDLPELNFYTTEQLVVLRKELGTFLDSEDRGCLDQSLPLLAMIATVDPVQILQFMTDYSKKLAEKNKEAEKEAPTEAPTFMPYDRMSSSQQEIVDEIQEYHEGFNELLAVQAVNELGEDAEHEEYIQWIERHESEMRKAANLARKDGREGLQTSADIMSKLMKEQPKGVKLLDKLASLWEGFVEQTSNTIKNFLGISHLGYVLYQVALQKQKTGKSSQRKIPLWLNRGKPCLIAVPQSKIYQMVLTIYRSDGKYAYPTRNEVLVCNRQTRVEEVRLFLSRALNDPLSFYCVVNCHLLSYEVCRLIENRLSNTADDTVKEYGLAFIYAEEKKDARIRSYLDKHLVKNMEYADLANLQHYVMQILAVPASMAKTACSVDPQRSSARLIRSRRAGVGKSLQKQNLCSKLRQNKALKGRDITIPIYKAIETDGIVRRLAEELGNGYTDSPHNTIHIDIAHEVEEGADELLFNLIVLRSIVNSEGVVWQAQPTQYYIIECMPFTRTDMSCAHEVMDMLPTTMCITPEEARNLYTNNRGQLPANFIGFNEATLRQPEWQTVFKYLKCHENNDVKYDVPKTPFTSPLDALNLLIRYCGLRDPTWSELRHYVYFLSDQLSKVEGSPYTSLAIAEDLPGFRQFVIRFMFRMAEDFATRSLKIAEETPGLNLHEIQDGGGKNNVLEQLAMKRTWESGNHPYLFFNEDGATFSPLGFFVEPKHGVGRPFSLVDCQTKEILDPECMTRDLKRALDQYKLSMSEDFDKLGRTMQLEKLRNVMVNVVRLSKPVARPNGSQIFNEEPMFRNDDPDTNYVLTMDNAKKILAIHQRLRVNIPVIIMGETGCGKTKLIDFMSKLQVPTSLKDQITTMIIVKIHGGTTEADIIQKVQEAQKLAVKNRQICKDYADEYDSPQVPTVYTILFLDEANTTEAIGLVKEILCDHRMRGVPLDMSSGLKIIAACNPYRKHTDAMIEKLKKAGLGYSVGEAETKDKFGQIPMRHLVYRVQALSQSLLPLVWDFGTLRSMMPQNATNVPKGDIENAYIRQMIVKFNQSNQVKGEGLNFGYHSAIMSEILTMTQAFMRQQKDECSFVSLRDIQRLLDVANWFYSQRDHLYPAMDKLAGNAMEEDFDVASDAGDEETVVVDDKFAPHKDYTTRSLVLALGVCYLARLEDETRLTYANYVGDKLAILVGGSRWKGPGVFSGAHYLFEQIELCQDMFIKEVMDQNQHKNIAKNKALKENVFMMIVCIENRIPLFLVGKPGSSKSLSKAMVVEAMKGKRSESEVFMRMKQTYMVSFQCSRHATPAGIVGVFNHCANFQKEQVLEKFVSVVVLDEVGLAEDSENMPLKTLHPLLEDGCEGNKKPEEYMKCAFVGISNWALDPAKMNRGIFVQRGTPEPDELQKIAKEICRSSASGDNAIGPFIAPLASGYLDICKSKKPDERDLTEFFGLRDFYSLMKMVVNFADSTGELNRNQLEHSIRRNFGGFDPDKFDPMEVFKNHCPALETLKEQEDGRPPIDSIGLIQSSLSGEDTALEGMESRYLLILTENLSVLSIILNEFTSHNKQPEVVFGSKFRDDVSYTQVCHNIYRIKTCMDMGKPVILLNLDDLYESLYDALNQYFSTWGDRKFVDLGLGTHRVKTFVDDKFRLVVIADKNKVHSQFPIPLINRLEKHYVSATSLLTAEQKQVKRELEQWAEEFITPLRTFKNVCPADCEGCGLELSKPYKMACLQHYIGPCCRQKMHLGQIAKVCPVEDCGKLIGADYAWDIDIAALENRQYFENSTRETAFIGYSTETTALAVRKADEDLWCDDLTESELMQKLLKRSKFHLLQCATGEAVLRLDKTALQDQAKPIQEVYMHDQYHETLVQYLQHELPLANGSFLHIQVTSFAELMNSKDVQTLRDSLNQPDPVVEVKSIFLKDFVKEDQFIEAVRSFYDAESEYGDKLLLVQCESANENIELLDSVRFIIQRESDTAKQRSEGVGAPTHTVLLLNLPRGHTFTGYQGGKWQCVHIDDPRSPEIRLPSLSKCMQLTPSQILEKVINSRVRTGITSGDIGGSVPSDDDDDDDGIMVIKREVEHTDHDEPPDADKARVQPSLTENEDEQMFRDMLPFIRECLPAALSIIKTDQQYDRVKLLRKLLAHNQDFVSIFLRHLHTLLQKEEENNVTHHWVKADAAKASNMKQSETLRHSLEDSLERAIVPGLAAVISFVDVRENLQILDSRSPLRELWMGLFDQCHKLGLKFNQITKRNKAEGSRSRLPRSYRIQEVGQGHHFFRALFPYSWVVKETIDDLMAAAVKANMDFDASGESFVDQFKMSVIGRLVTAADTNEQFHNQMLDAYIKDFVNMAHPCSSSAEHWIVCCSILTFIKNLGILDISMVHVHLAYNQLTAVFENLSIILSLTTDDHTKDLAARVKTHMEADAKDEITSMPCDLLALHRLLLVLGEVKVPDILSNPERWVEQVEKCKLVVRKILDSNNDSDDVNVGTCRNLWLRLDLKKLYVEHVIAPSPINKKTGKRNPYKLSFFMKSITGESFQTYQTFQQVVTYLQGTVREGLKVFYPNCPKQCPGCQKPLDSPVRLKKCKHLMCDTCVKEANICLEPGCGKPIPDNYTYSPADDNIDEEQLAAFKALRKRLNKFFMSFVSDIVFSADEDPDDKIIVWLLNCITFGSGTRQFSLFASADVVDPSPVLRSFLLKLLLQCNRSASVYAHLDRIMSSWAADKTQHLQTMVLLMDCQKDIHIDEIPSDAKGLSGTLGIYSRVLLNPLKVATVDYLMEVAIVQSSLNQSVDLLSMRRAAQSQQLEDGLRQFLQTTKQAGNSEPGYLIARQLLVTHGESYIKDLVSTPREYLIPDDVKQDLQSFTVPDVLSVFGGQPYKNAIAGLDAIIAQAVNVDAFTNAVNQFKQNCKDDGVLLQALFTRVTRTQVQLNPVGPQRRNALLAELQKGPRNAQRSALLEMLLRDGGLPREMDVNQSKGINLTMLVLHLYSCLCSGAATADLHPLAEIINQPLQAATRFLPTMADNQLELMQAEITQALGAHGDYGAAVYKCPNGHPYYIGNCGRPVDGATCKEKGCGAPIGGAGDYDVAHAGNEKVNADDKAAKSQPGHILGTHTERMEATPERDLNTLSCAVLRCITHLCIFTASVFNKQQVLGVIQPHLPRQEDIQPFLEAHILLDLQQIANCCAESQDDCILLVHRVISRMKGAARKGANSVLDTIQERRKWEKQFDSNYIKPTFNKPAAQIQNVRQSLMAADTVDIKRLLLTDNKPVNENNILASAVLWCYRRPLTLSAIRNLLDSSIKGCPNLQKLVSKCQMLIALQHLPGVLSLISTLNDRFHSRLSRDQASKQSIGEFCHLHDADIADITHLVQSFTLAWNAMLRCYGENSTTKLRELDEESVVTRFLIGQKREESAPYMLVAFLTDVHNAMLHVTKDTKGPKIPLSAVNTFNIVSIKSQEEILSLIASHSEYELRETTAITYNWPAIEREVLHRYVSNKPRIIFTKDQLPCYVYQEDINLHNQMEAIDDSQEALTIEQQASIVKVLNISVPTLTSYLKELKVIINFLSVRPHIEGDDSLAEYMETTFGRDISYLSKEIKLKHIKHVWLLVKYTQTDLLMRKHQEPFDDIDAECREALTAIYKAELDLCCTFNSPRTKLLLQELFKYIVLRLNRAAVEQDPHHKHTADNKRLQDALTEFIQFRSKEGDEVRIAELLEELPNLPPALRVKHASKAWSYIWTRFTTQVE